MYSVDIKLNKKGVAELLKSPEIAAVCEEQAARMTRATGMEYVSDVHVGKKRANAGGYDSAENAAGYEVKKQKRKRSKK